MLINEWGRTQDSRIGTIEASSGPPHVSISPSLIKSNRISQNAEVLIYTTNSGTVGLYIQLPLPASTPVSCTSQAHLHEQHPNLLSVNNQDPAAYRIETRGQYNHTDLWRKARGPLTERIWKNGYSRWLSSISSSRPHKLSHSFTLHPPPSQPPRLSGTKAWTMRTEIQNRKRTEKKAKTLHSTAPHRWKSEAASRAGGRWQI